MRLPKTGRTSIRPYAPCDSSTPSSWAGPRRWSAQSGSRWRRRSSASSRTPRRREMDSNHRYLARLVAFFVPLRAPRIAAPAKSWAGPGFDALRLLVRLAGPYVGAGSGRAGRPDETRVSSTSGSSRNVTPSKTRSSAAGREASRLTRTEPPPEGTGPNSRSSANGRCPIDYVNLVRLIARS